MDGRRMLERGAAILGVLGLFGVLPFYLAAGLAAPVWAIAALLVFWLALLTLAIRWFRTNPWPVLALPVLAAAVWWATMTLGEAVLDWQA